MAYIAHAAILLANDENSRDEDSWHFIKHKNNIEYRWKFSNDFTYHVIAGVFDKAMDALDCAKQLYVTLFYELVWHGFQIADAGCSLYETRLFHDGWPEVIGYTGDEAFFFWTKNYQGGKLGPGVFEVDWSIDEFDEYRFIDASITIRGDSDLSFQNVDTYYFSYCREAQKYFNTIMLAESSLEFGMKMTIYCGILEHLSENRDKDQDVLYVIDDLINFVSNSSLSQEKKESLKNVLNTSRRISAKQKCINSCEKYAKQRYGGFTFKSIINEAYKIRSAFSHGENCEDRYSKCAIYIKFVVLDIIKNIMREKENCKSSDQQ